MKWSFWIELYIRTHCVARGLRPLTIAAYEKTLKQFRDWVRVKLCSPTSSICAKCAITAIPPSTAPWSCCDDFMVRWLPWVVSIIMTTR